MALVIIQNDQEVTVVGVNNAQPVKVVGIGPVATISGGGTVTSVALAMPTALFDSPVVGSPITVAGTFAPALSSQTANKVFASPDGAPGTPVFRALVAADIPNLDASKITTGVFSIARGGTGQTTANAALNALLPNQIGNNGKVLQTDGANTSWQTSGAGTVTGFSFTNANGISGVVANPATTPALTLTLGDITPTTVNGLTLTSLATGFTIAGGTISKTLTVSLDAAVSGTNTGDQTITLTNDVTGSGTGSFATTIANQAVTFAKFQNVSTQTLIGRSTAGSGSVEQLTLGAGLTLAGGILTATGSGGTVTSINATGSNGITVAGVPITGSGTIAIDVAANGINLDRIQQTGANTILGNNTGIAANIAQLTTAQVKTMLNLSGTNSGDVTLAGENYLSIAGQVITAAAVNLTGTNITGQLKAASFPTLTGDVTTAGGSLATTIANNAVTYAKMQAVSTTSKLLGSSSTTTAVQEITIGSGLSLTGTTLSVTVAGGTVTSVGLSMPAEFAVANTPITTADTFGVTWASQTGNVVLASPALGGAGAPAFRSLVAADIPNISAAKIASGTLAVNVGGTGQSSYTNGQLLIGNTVGNTLAKATLTGTASRLSVTNGNGSITLDIDAAYVGQATITTLGTVTTGTWNAIAIDVAYGGTGQTSYTDGQLLIGKTIGNTLVKTTLTGTANRLSVANGSGTITLNIDTNYAGQSTIATLGTITTGTWNGTKISEAYGGTNQSTYATGDTLYASAANTLSKLTIGTTNYVLRVVGGIPSWQPELLYIAEALNTSAPNATINTVSLTVTGGSTNADFALVPKGTGALLAQVPDNAGTGGNKRGTNAVDLQTIRASATSVASGTTSVVSGGDDNAASGTSSAVGGGHGNLASNAEATVGGGNLNTASGTTSTVGGGDSNTASALDSTVGGGNSNTASGTHSTVGGGDTNTASGNYSGVLGGASNVASQTASMIGGGQQNQAAGANSAIPGGYDNGTTADSAIAIGREALAANYGQLAHAAGFFAARGDAQAAEYVLRNSTAGNALTSLFLDGSSLKISMPTNGAFVVHCLIVGKVTGNLGPAVGGWELIALAYDNGGSTSVVGSILRTLNTPAGWGTPAVGGGAGIVDITVTGAIATNIDWVARVQTAEITF